MADRKPNWKVWANVQRVEAWGAVALSLDIEPRSVRMNRDGWMAGPGAFIHDEGQEYSDRLEVVTRNGEKFLDRRVDTLNPEAQIPLPAFARFALELGWTVPAELSALASPLTPAPVRNADFWLNQPSWTLEQAAQLLCEREPLPDGFSRSDATAGSPNDIYSRMKGARDDGQLVMTKGRGSSELRHYRVKPADVVGWALSINWQVPRSLSRLARPAEKPLQAPEKELKTRERDSLLAIIAALADMAGVDLATPSKSGVVIESKTQDLGHRVASKTAAEHLKSAAGLVEKKRRP